MIHEFVETLRNNDMPFNFDVEMISKVQEFCRKELEQDPDDLGMKLRNSET